MDRSLVTIVMFRFSYNALTNSKVVVPVSMRRESPLDTNSAAFSATIRFASTLTFMRWSG